MHVTTVAAGGVDLVVREWGTTNVDPLLFWPALNPWSSLQLIEVGPLLALRGFRIIAIAAPGTGESSILAEAEQYLPTRLAELALEIADAFSLERFGFIGASWGASIGVRLAASHPERVSALVLLDGGYDDSPVDADSLPEFEQQVAADQEHFAFDSWDAYLEWAREHTARWSDELEARYREGMTEAGGKIVVRGDPLAAAWALWGLSLEPVREVHATLGQADVPTLLIVPDDRDSTAEIVRFRAHVPQAVIEHLDASHDILQDRPHETVETIAAWIPRLGTEAGLLGGFRRIRRGSAEEPVHAELVGKVPVCSEGQFA